MPYFRYAGADTQTHGRTDAQTRPAAAPARHQPTWPLPRDQRRLLLSHESHQPGWGWEWGVLAVPVYSIDIEEMHKYVRGEGAIFTFNIYRNYIK